MASLCYLVILLLCAPIITLPQDVSTSLPPRITTNSASISVTSSPPRTMAATAAPKPPPTSAASPSSSTQQLISDGVSVTPSPPASISNPASPTPSTHSDSQKIPTQTQTSPPVTTGQTPPQCLYTVKSIPFGLQINMFDNSTAGSYTVNLTEEGGPEMIQQFNFQSSNQNTPHEIKHLKPCTEYQHSVAFIDTDGNKTFCQPTEDKNKTTTDPMSNVKVEDGISTPGFICFQSGWDISSSLSAPKKALQCTNKTCCIELDFEDICSDFTATFTSGNCVDSSVNVNKSITVDFLNPSEINHTVSTGLPATINLTLPSKCNDPPVDYNCSESGKAIDYKNLSEPFTDYSCTGLIKVNSVSINTRPIPVRIDCSFTINTSKISTTNTSIELNWETTSDKCRDVLPELKKFSYNCNCKTKSQSETAGKLNQRPDGGKCNFTGLKPYTDYTCGIVPTYNKERVDHSKQVKLKTDPGTPEDIKTVSATLKENNVIQVSCVHSRTFFGRLKIFRARLINGEDEPQENGHCEFEFKDLSYFTSYTVEVKAYNGELESKPETVTISTTYNAALIGSLSFLLLVISVVLFVVIYKIYIQKRKKSRSGVNDNMMLEPTAIYANARPPGWRHKAAR